MSKKHDAGFDKDMIVSVVFGLMDEAIQKIPELEKNATWGTVETRKDFYDCVRYVLKSMKDEVDWRIDDYEDELGLDEEED